MQEACSYPIKVLKNPLGVNLPSPITIPNGYLAEMVSLYYVFKAYR
jgi:hypothetical protein